MTTRIEGNNNVFAANVNLLPSTALPEQLHPPSRWRRQAVCAGLALSIGSGAWMLGAAAEICAALSTALLLPVSLSLLRD